MDGWIKRWMDGWINNWIHEWEIGLVKWMAYG